MSAEAVRSARAALAQRPVRLDIMEHYDCPAESSAEQTAACRELTLAAVAQIKDLSAPCQVVLALRYFVGPELREVARLMEITESRASHLHTEAVLAVRDALADAASTADVGWGQMGQWARADPSASQPDLYATRAHRSR